MSYITIFDAILAVLGLYLLYAALQMKRTGKISTLLVSDEEMKACRDRQGFIDGIYKQTFLFGIVLLLFGIADGVNGVMNFFGKYFGVAGAAVFLLSCLLYLKEMRKVKETFME